ncbi:hypothetical protein LCGC14_1509420 [marine sediment metagenome]|uniref:Uncharacterized protein n=1 Tax=marine sediment metagenome TaxID=412755 RepID=A0A0F9J1V9_9ZZZZ
MVATKRDDLLVSRWATFCCHLDLFQIKNEQDVEYYMKHLHPDSVENLGPVHVWDTQKEALEDIRTWWNPENYGAADVIAEIDERLVQ